MGLIMGATDRFDEESIKKIKEAHEQANAEYDARMNEFKANLESQRAKYEDSASSILSQAHQRSIDSANVRLADMAKKQQDIEYKLVHLDAKKMLVYTSLLALSAVILVVIIVVLNKTKSIETAVDSIPVQKEIDFRPDFRRMEDAIAFAAGNTAVLVNNNVTAETGNILGKLAQLEKSLAVTNASIRSLRLGKQRRHRNKR